MAFAEGFPSVHLSDQNQQAFSISNRRFAAFEIVECQKGRLQPGTRVFSNFPLKRRRAGVVKSALFETAFLETF
ncbi:hypothetical protein [Zhenpiania hominis]|uniref:Uncharacterized protein n=1 Tax=Zhenpiania hominis TaxID=2763644 RepID=A0A923NL13_9FIRM|nr:hypothetical protein [Zhenpiania hominis]MBC6681076.1 hypothetical protein [Zhenpiania hominis]